MISVVIPTYNEKENLAQLTSELINALNSCREKYELIFIDDHSTDGSFEYLHDLKKHMSVIQVYSKQGQQGKTYSLIEGFHHARGNKIVMIDADLQYPPQYIPKMIAKLSKYDIVVGNRIKTGNGFSVRRILSAIYKFAFGKILLGLPYDVQSGLKAFKKQVLHNLNISPSRWAIDFEFLFKAQRIGWKIGQIDVPFLARINGNSNISILRDGWELAYGALSLRLKYLFLSIFKFADYPHRSERMPIQYSNEKDYLFVPEIQSAKKHIYPESVSFVLTFTALLAASIWLLHQAFSVPILIIISGIGALFYLGLMIFKLYVVKQSFKKQFVDFSAEEIANIDESELPVYTILIPLYQEAEVIRQIVKAMSAIDYPKDKLDIIITLEEYDLETIHAIEQVYPPEHFKTLILPNVHPKTKPKALNVALLQTKGEYLVIYDAEIIPEPDQLKKAYLAFKKYPEVACLQTRLDHYNASQTFLTKLFNAEFSFHFDLFLPGLQKLGYPIPLSGHSTHFRTEALQKIGGWDPYNVTEDCDTGIRLARLGYKVDILNSLSREEATTTMGAWVKQRSRWIKGFIQTTIVHLRHPFRFSKEIGGLGKLAAFVFTVPVSVAANLINVVYWILLFTWLFTKSNLIASYFPAPILYVSFFSFVVGNFIFVYLNLIGSYKRGRYEFVKYSLLSPIYWLLLAYATVIATIQLVVKPHHWEKTKHGKHLETAPELIPLERKYDVNT